MFCKLLEIISPHVLDEQISYTVSLYIKKRVTKIVWMSKTFSKFLPLVILKTLDRRNKTH